MARRAGRTDDATLLPEQRDLNRNGQPIRG